jgi:PAS domain S-box-containing protein
MAEPYVASGQAAIASGEGQEFEITLDLPIGTRTYHISEQPIAELDGRRTGVVSASIDITARKRIEEALRASEKKYRQLSESLMDAYAAVDMDGWIVEFNEAFAAMIGYPQGLVRQLTYEAITPEVWHAHEADMIQRQVLVRGYSDIYQKEYRRRDGTVFPVELRVNLIRDEAGNPTGMWAVIRDITQRQQAEAALREASERLALTQKAAGAGAWEWNILTDQLIWSPEMFVLFDLDPQAGASFDAWRAVLHPEDRALAEARIAEALQAHRRLESQYRVIWPSDGQVHWINAIGQGLYDDQGAPLRMNGICLDITAQKQAEAALRASEARLRETAEENARLLALSRKDALTQATLLHEVNHRVKNNLAAIIGLLYLEQRYRSAGDQAPYETLVHDLTGRIQSLALVHDLLSAGAWAPLPLAQLAERVLQGALALMPLQSHVQVSVRPSPVQLTSKQASALGLILNELATNAFKHAAPAAGGLYLILDIAQAHGNVRLEFSDNGPGFPADVLNGSRQNIGLHLIRNLTEHDLGGTLDLSNRGGAVARLSFPAAPAEPGADTTREDPHG